MASEYPKHQRVKLAQLKRSPDAPRRRSPATVHVVGLSLKEFGLLKIPTWNARSGNVLSLHSVVEAERDAGQEELDVWVVDLDEVHEAAALLMLNAHLNDWEWEHVATLLKKVRDGGLDLKFTGLPESDTGPLLAAEWKPAGKVPLNDVHADDKQDTMF